MTKDLARHDVYDVLHKLDQLIDDGRSVKINDVFDDLNIFDWWKDDLTISDMKKMKVFLKEAVRLGFTGHCCFKVGISGCSNGMWADRDQSDDGYSPKRSPCLYRAFTPSYDYWAVDMTGDGSFLPERDKYDQCKTITDLKDYVIKAAVQSAAA